LWKDGSTGSTYEATAAKMEKMKSVVLLSESYNVKEAPFNAKATV